MNDDDDFDDSFWITEIATDDPANDAAYVPIGKIMLIIAAVVLIGLLIVALR